jgi:hypothetical protein
MIVKTYILANLRALNKHYGRAATPKEAQFSAKLAILELCGWIEESMDDIVLVCARKHLKIADNLAYCENEVVKRTYGFDYHSNFRFMLIRLLGLIAVESIERQVDPATHGRMTSALSTLKLQRNSEAHTHLKGVTRTVTAPSVTIAQFQPVYEGLIEIDRIVRSAKF